MKGRLGHLSLYIYTSQQHSTLICLDAGLMFAISHAFYTSQRVLHFWPLLHSNTQPLLQFTTTVPSPISSGLKHYSAFWVCYLEFMEFMEFMEFRRFGHTHTRYEKETHQSWHTQEDDDSPSSH